MNMRFVVTSLALMAAACASPPVTQTRAAPDIAPTTAADPLVGQSREAVQAYVDRNQFSGAVLVAREGEPVFREGFGLANLEWNIPNTPDTIFRLGSITKQFTAAAILQLAEQGKLSLQDPVSTYYTAAPPSWSKVTIHHLLSHRSGIGDYTEMKDFFEKHASVDRTPAEIVGLTHDVPLAFEPGSKFAYNNSGYVLLGYVIEKVSGQSYAEYVAEHIFKPLGMTQSGYDDSASVLPHRAAGYTIGADGWRNAPYLAMSLPYAAGSLYATVGDLLIWEEALFGGKVLSPASREAMMTDNGDGYGYGLVIGSLGGHRNIWHNGGINGFATHMNRFVDDGLTVIVLANLESAPSGRIATELSRLWLGIPPPPPITAVDVASEVLVRYVGVYELMPGFNITIARVDAGLTAQATGQGAFPLTATSDTEFRYEPAGIRIVFPAGDGPAPGFTLHQGGPREARRIDPPPAN